ncbi:hypothetical protein, partial [Escherichia coli]|uniref:hypothetical protein n=1 Tax=Escherichia coli TaxID=562 RepID=UPI00200E13EF
NLVLGVLGLLGRNALTLLLAPLLGRRYFYHYIKEGLRRSRTLRRDVGWRDLGSSSLRRRNLGCPRLLGSLLGYFF